jgi:hypothetical protein
MARVHLPPIPALARARWAHTPEIVAEQHDDVRQFIQGMLKLNLRAACGQVDFSHEPESLPAVCNLIRCCKRQSGREVRKMSGSKLIHPAYPIAGLAGTLLLCAYILHGGDFLVPAAEAQGEIASEEDAS